MNAGAARGRITGDGTAGPSARGCPYSAGQVDLCPQAVMTWRNQSAVCAYAVVSHDGGGDQRMCTNPHRIL